MTELASLVVFTEQPEETVAFYRALGVPLEDEDHGDGAIRAAGEVGGVAGAVLPARTSRQSTGRRTGGSTFVGFWVTSREATVAAFEALGRWS